MLRHRGRPHAPSASAAAAADDDEDGNGYYPQHHPPSAEAAADASMVAPTRQLLRVGFANLVVRGSSSPSSSPPKTAKTSSTTTTAAATPPSPLLSAAAQAQDEIVVDHDLQSVGSCSYTSITTNPPKHSQWTNKYVPPPVVPQSIVIAFGLLCFVLAYLWPPLLLLVTYVASKLIPYSYRLNDDASYRRQRYREFAVDESQPELFRNPPEEIVKIDEGFWVNDRGMALSTMIMRPVSLPCHDDANDDVSSTSSSTTTSLPPGSFPLPRPRAVVCLCHGYSDNLSYSKKVEYQRMAQAGIAVVGIEYEGHGRSDGPLCLIEDWDRMIHDVATYFQQTIQQQFQDVPVFLMGESMGGAVAYSVYHRTPALYRGVVFVCPMCKISDDMLPPQWVIDALKWIVGPTGSPSSWIGQLPLAPSKSDLYETAHHVPSKAEQIYRCPTSYGRNPRLVTARELLHATSNISSSLSEFDAPFLIVHGREDRVTDPQLSLSLYRESKSADKSIRLYDGMWHGITSTEPDDNIDRVFRDCIEWIVDRAAPQPLVGADGGTH